MKHCSKCNCEKELSEFYKNTLNKKTGLSAYCKCCSKADKKVHYVNNKNKYIDSGIQGRKWFMDYKRSLECSRCGFNHPAALDFHHRDPSTKSLKFESIAMVKKNEKIIMEEIAKCDILCSNCHRIEHSKHY
tara:strand:+ start:336 stop:731 length:396 start_codon:yes stop_codon:yes gene_type:complete